MCVCVCVCVCVCMCALACVRVYTHVFIVLFFIKRLLWVVLVDDMLLFQTVIFIFLTASANMHAVL